MKLAIDAANDLAIRALTRIGYEPGEAVIIADHLMDCELRGLGFSGLARIVSVAERLKDAAPAASSAGGVVRETAVSAHIDGADRIGYLVAREAAELASEKAATTGIGVVGAYDTWYTGMLSYYAEIITGRGQVAMLASNATPWVAPFGGSEARFGTNPFCFGFPGDKLPLIWDIGISEIIHAQALLAKRTGVPLPDGVAYDAAGMPTTDPAAALTGAFVAWGGHRGSGLGVSVQLLGALVGSSVSPLEVKGFGFFVLALDPALFGEPAVFRGKVTEYQALLRSTRPVDEAKPVRVPFERSDADRRRRRDEGVIEVAEPIVEKVSSLADA